MKPFNLTEWSLKHKQLIYYFITVIFLGGIISYQNLGRMEDPDFTIRQMIVSVNWPGATARQVEEQVTDKIERKLQDTPGLDYLKSYSVPGQSVIYVSLKEDTVVADKVHPTWLQVRNMVNDIKATLPQGIDGPYFNDWFDDVFGCIYALTGDGYSLKICGNGRKLSVAYCWLCPALKKSIWLAYRRRKFILKSNPPNWHSWVLPHPTLPMPYRRKMP